MGCKILQRPFQERFFIGRVGLAMITQYTKFEVSRFIRYEAMNAKMGWFRAVRGHSRSWAMPPYDRANTTSYSTLIETMRLYCTVFEI